MITYKRLLIISIGLLFIILFQPVNAPTNNQVIDSEIKSNFDTIHSIPYNTNSSNCTTKTELFGNYLLSLGATEVMVMDISRSDNGYGHRVILYMDRVYDPTSGVYNMTKNDYVSFVVSKGFNGLIVTYPFESTNNIELCKLMAGE